jgi:C-terminal processing protease CtpA/Prc
MIRRRVRLENFTGKASSIPQADVGLFAAYDSRKKRMRIAAVVPDGPADKAGLQVGDDLLAVGSKEIGLMSFRNLQTMLQGELGSVVTIDVSRAGKYTKHKLERTHLFNEAETQQAR